MPLLRTMARATRAAEAAKAAIKTSPKRSLSPLVKAEQETPRKRVKRAVDAKPVELDKAAVLRDRKLSEHAKHSSASIYPSFPHPTRDECKLAHSILASIHGARVRPAQVVASATRAGCGDSPSVLDALVRTILSQNTSDTNSTRAKLAMDAAYGGSDEWENIVKGGQARLEEAIRSGGLSQVKSKVIINILEQTHAKYSAYSLDHLHEASTEDAMAELLSLKGVGPKTASCVLMFCLQRADFPVDTHVQRITGLLGWRPPKANREQTYAHLNERIPDEDKYGLHTLIVQHGKVCAECKAGGRSSGKCELRTASSRRKVKGEEEIKDETQVTDEELQLVKNEAKVDETQVKNGRQLEDGQVKDEA